MPLPDWLLLRREIDPTSGCWIWPGGKIAQGYGHVRLPKGGPVLVHRFAYKTWVDPDLPDDACVLHACDNPPCFNPDHLFAGTRKDNSDDRDRKGRNSVRSGEAHWMHRHPERILRGDNHQNAKLTTEKVRAIRSDPRDAAIVAGEYGIAKITVYDVRSRRSWKHVT
jgi:hypothetical protein